MSTRQVLREFRAATKNIKTSTTIAYLLNNVLDETGNGYSVTFSALHRSEVSASAIAAAQAKGWTVAFV